MRDLEATKYKNDNNDNSINNNGDKSNNDFSGKVVHFFCCIAVKLFRMRDWKATKGPVSLPTS